MFFIKNSPDLTFMKKSMIDAAPVFIVSIIAPVIATLTGPFACRISASEEERGFLAAGANLFIAKPFSPHALKNRIEAICLT